MFCDQVHLEISSGKGGNGCVSFRREKYIPKGGPDGGDGGKGGNIIFVTNPHMNTLYHLRGKRVHKAQSGQYGMGNNKHGANGNDTLIEVPIGTIIFEEGTDHILADLSQDGMRYTAAVGGRGGYGNAHFTSSTRQTPDFAELGDIPEERAVRLELKLIADVGIIGLPSVGKSTLISVISNARPKIAEYPFTTLVPNLGVVAHKGYSFVVSDIPGLIEGASEGKGLGHQFLRHIERCSLLVHMVDGSHLDAIVSDINVINTELAQFSELLTHKKQILVVNKADLLDEELEGLMREKLAEAGFHEVYFLAAVTHQGLESLLDRLILLVQEEKSQRIEETQEMDKDIANSDFTPMEDGSALFQPLHTQDPERWDIFEEDGNVVVRGARIEQIARMTDTTKIGAMLRLHDVLKKLGIASALEKRHLYEGDVFYIGDIPVEFVETLD